MPTLQIGEPIFQAGLVRHRMALLRLTLLELLVMVLGQQFQQLRFQLALLVGFKKERKIWSFFRQALPIRVPLTCI
ncbi:MAG TPA: hypothetical protein VNN22_09560 [Verrucomicrobiae bacterium]|nr:hypothetical protein [Verrucomicrobiae bacterium]